MGYRFHISGVKFCRYVTFPDCILDIRNRYISERCEFGYKSKLLTLAKNCGFVVLIFFSPISSKKKVDTTYCGPPFVFILEDSSIYPKVKRCFMCYVDYIKIWFSNYVLSCHNHNLTIFADMKCISEIQIINTSASTPLAKYIYLPKTIYWALLLWLCCHSSFSMHAFFTKGFSLSWIYYSFLIRCLSQQSQPVTIKNNSSVSLIIWLIYIKIWFVDRDNRYRRII